VEFTAKKSRNYAVLCLKSAEMGERFKRRTHTMRLKT